MGTKKSSSILKSLIIQMTLVLAVVVALAAAAAGTLLISVRKDQKKEVIEKYIIEKGMTEQFTVDYIINIRKPLIEKYISSSPDKIDNKFLETFGLVKSSKVGSELAELNKNNLVFDKNLQAWILKVAYPIEVRGKVFGRIQQEVDLTDFFDDLNNRKIDDTVNFVVSRDGYIFYHPELIENIKSEGGRIPAEGLDIKMVDNFLSNFDFNKGDTYSFETGNLINGYLYSYTKLTGIDAYLVSTYPKYLFIKSSIESAQMVYMVGLFFLLIELVIVYWILKQKLIIPFFKLSKPAERLADGHYDAQVPTMGNDEFGVLSDILEKMTASIRAKDIELARYNNELEKIIKEKSNELEKQKMINLQASKMSTLGEMAGGVAHEINTPLGLIKILSQRSIESIQAGIPDLESIEADLKKIDKTTDHVAKIIKGLRAFARDVGGDQYALSSIQEIIKDTILLCSERLKNHNIKLILDEKASDVEFECRPIQISQVLLNLIGNACDSIVDMEEKWIELRYEKKDSKIFIYATDSGGGIPKEIQEKIFTPFFTTKEVGKGTGVGLSISAGIIASHKGTLKLNPSHPNTQFVIEIPLKQEPQGIKKTA